VKLIPQLSLIFIGAWKNDSQIRWLDVDWEPLMLEGIWECSQMTGRKPFRSIRNNSLIVSHRDAKMVSLLATRGAKLKMTEFELWD
jgi:hypothetical protein